MRINNNSKNKTRLIFSHEITIRFIAWPCSSSSALYVKQKVQFFLCDVVLLGSSSSKLAVGQFAAECETLWIKKLAPPSLRPRFSAVKRLTTLSGLGRLSYFKWSSSILRSCS